MRPDAHGAFTFVELAVVVLLMGIFAAVAIPTYLNSLVFYRIEAAGRRVQADLELVEQAARVASAAQTLTFTGSTYTAGAGVAGLNNPTGLYSVDLAAAPYQVSSVTANFGGAQFVAFDGFGAPNSGGTVVLTAPHYQCTITLDAATGMVSLSRIYAGGRAAE